MRKHLQRMSSACRFAPIRGFVLATALLGVAGLLLANPLTLTAAEGKVVEVIGKTVKVTAAAGKAKVGDRIEIFTVLPGLDEEATVATGRVFEVDGQTVLIKIERASGQVALGQQIRILPAAAAQPNSDSGVKPAAPVGG